MHSGLSFSLRQVDAGAQQGTKRVFTEKLAKRPADAAPDFGDPEVNSKVILAARAMQKGLPVLLLGDTGTGKEVMATSLHQNSAFASGGFVAINCAAVPEALIESELFGHTEGAYTGARRGGAAGKIEQADRGTLFLDEIGDMPLVLQSRLLRVLESREVTRLGSITAKKVQFQLICATHRNLTDAVSQGEFRDDLLYRIKGMTVRLPRLRARSELRAFIIKQCRVLTDGGRELSEECLERLVQHDWPGNVRELFYALTHADALAPPRAMLDLGYFPEEVTASRALEAKVSKASGGGTLKTMERTVIDQALAMEDGNISRAAKRLGIGRATLYRKLKASTDAR